MNRPTKRRTSPSVSALEPRSLLTSLTGAWLGQDQHDLVGPSSVLGADGIQDIHLTIAGLPTSRTITSAEVDGLGGGRWSTTGQGVWLAALVRTAGSGTADLYVEPYQVETGRPFQVNLSYDDGSSDNVWINGGAADPTLRMPSAIVQAQWLGQDGHDLTGNSPSVGPDGIQDAHVTLAHLAANVPIVAVTIDGPAGDNWQFGQNHEGDINAELVRNASDPSLADLYFNPHDNLSGQTLTITVLYANAQTDHTTLSAGATNPGLAMPPAPAVPIALNTAHAQWLGQDGQNLVGRGDVHVVVTGLPTGRTVVAATLADDLAGSWVYRSASQPNYYADSFAMPMAARPGSQAGQVDFDFPPIRDEADTTMTMRLLLDDGSTSVVQFAGGHDDPGLRSAGIAPTTFVAHPGDNLSALANVYGTVHLTAGTYALSQPLVLNHAVTINADPGAVLVFSQPATAQPWTTAIKIQDGHTTLDGFSVQFATPVRWNWNTNFGPAVIGTTDNFDINQNDAREAITISHMTITSPPAASSWEEAPHLLRLVSASSGQILSNTLKGGTTEFENGPWTIVGNNYQGTVPNTFTATAFAAHNTHDLVLSNNTAQPVGPSGKTWRFLVMTNSGVRDQVRGNTVIGIGPRDSDTVPSVNASEVVLTESYRLHFEGTPAAISSNGLVLQIPTPQGTPAQTGDVVSVLSGPQAGQWRRIALAINPTTYVLDQPLPAGNSPISIATGFVQETYAANTIDTRGSSVAVDLDLQGNHYGTQVLNNQLLGGSAGFLLSAAPTEQPVMWGWSHTPFLGANVAGNVIIDAITGGILRVDHGPPIKSNRGREYMSASLLNNKVEWTSAFLTSHSSTQPQALVIGQEGSIDPEELVLIQAGNGLRGPAGYVPPGPTMQVPAALVNGTEQVDQAISLPIAPPDAPGNLRLVHDDGTSATDKVTTDAHLQFDPGPLGAVGYEYRLGTSTTYTPLGSSTAFLPTGLRAGGNTVFVRALDDAGRRGPDAAITFTLVVPTPVVLSGQWIGQDGHDLVGPSPLPGGDGIQDIHIALAGLPAARTITFAEVQGLGGGDWQYNGPWGRWMAALVRTPGSTTADLYIQPSQRETGRPFSITLRYDTGATVTFWIQGGTADPTLRMPSALHVAASSATPAPAPAASAPARAVSLSNVFSNVPAVVVGTRWNTRPFWWHTNAAEARSARVTQAHSHVSRHVSLGTMPARKPPAV